MKRNNASIILVMVCALLFSTSIEAMFSQFFYGMTSFALPWAYAINEAKKGEKFVEYDRSLFDKESELNYKINTGQFDSNALCTKSYDKDKLLSGLAVPPVVATITRCAIGIPASLVVRHFLYKAPVRIVRGSFNGIAALAIISSYDAIKKEVDKKIAKDREMENELKEMRKEVNNSELNIREALKK